MGLMVMNPAPGWVTEMGVMGNEPTHFCCRWYRSYGYHPSGSLLCSCPVVLVLSFSNKDLVGFSLSMLTIITITLQHLSYMDGLYSIHSKEPA